MARSTTSRRPITLSRCCAQMLRIAARAASSAAPMATSALMSPTPAHREPDLRARRPRRLGDHACHAELGESAAVLLLVPAGHQYHGDLAGLLMGFEFLHRCGSIHVGHDHIEQDGVGAIRNRRREPLGARLRGGHHETPVALQGDARDLTDQQRVVHYQHTPHAARSGAGAFAPGRSAYRRARQAVSRSAGSSPSIKSGLSA